MFNLKAKITLFVVLLFGFSGTLLASTCTVENYKISSLYIRFTDGVVNIGLNNAGGGFYVCKIGGIYNSIDPDECKMLYSQLLTAYSANKKVNMVFQNESCPPPPDTSWTPVNLYGVSIHD